MNFFIIYSITLLHLNLAINRSSLSYELDNLTESSVCLAGYISKIIQEVRPYTTILDLSVSNDSNDDVTSAIVKESSYIVRRSKKSATKQLYFMTLVILWHTSQGCPSNQEIEILSSKIKDLNYEVPRVPLILILQSKIICKKLADLLQELQGPYAYRLVILTLTLANGCHVSLHTYDHFTRTYSIFPEINNITVFPNKIRKLNGFKLKVAIAKNPPNVYLERNMETGEANNIGGFEVNILKIVVKKLDLNMEIVPRFNEFFNGKFSNGTPTGVVVELFEHKHDLTGNSLYIYMYNDRFSRFVECTRPYNYLPLCIVILSNDAVTVVNSFVGVKELTIVYCCVLTVVWFGLSIVPKDHPVRGILKTLGNLFGSGVPFFPKRWSAKIFLMSLTVLFAMMFAKLQSLLTSSLIYEIVPNDIKTLKQLESTGYTLLLGEGHYNMTFDYFRNLNEDHYYKRLQVRARIFEDKNLCIQLLVQRKKYDNIGCVVEKYIGLSFIHKFPELVMVEECLLTHWKGFALFKGYYALPMINKVLSILTDSGITDKIVSASVRIRPKVITKNVTYKLTLKNFYTVTYIIITLYMISIAVFIIEILNGRYNKISSTI